jgi:transcription antitermination factor NusG
LLRLDENPVARFPFARPLEDDVGCWAVAHVKARQEKALAQDLACRDIPYYLPLTEKRSLRRDNGKIRKSIIPLFPGYLAFALEHAQWETVYRTGRVAELLPVLDQESFLADLLQVQRALESPYAVELLPTYEPGQPVRVLHGPLMGFEGEVLRQRNESMFIIRVRMFNRAVKVELDEVYLEAV